MKNIQKWLSWIEIQATLFYHDQRGELLEKAGIIAAATVAILLLIGLFALAGNKISEASSWFN